jgi:serine/threonine protein kinase/tetratricopeptide (TPR) repeat protein
LKKLGKYEVLGELGHGAMGVVYRARDPIINRLVALKTITTGVADDPNLLQRFYREAQSAGGLQHPNIVTIYDMGEAGNLPYIAMELVEGENLEQTIARRAPLPISLKLVYAMQACRAFDYAHKRGIIHRDIKPGNVMVNRDGIVKVVDFGIARVMETSRTQTGMLIGTFAYMSPEQYHGEHADERSDIWSFGVLMYELLAYQRPFTGATPASLMHSICQQEPNSLVQVLPDCPSELEVVMARILRKSPGDRYQSMEDLLLELEPICKKLQVQAVIELVAQGRERADQKDFTEARDLLRQALQIDSGNQQARSLLEKVNVEIKRLQARPKVQQFVDKGRALLEEGKTQEAKSAAETALQLDSTFEPAQELQKQVLQEIDKAQRVADWLQNSKQHLAEGMPEEAEVLVARVLEVDPSNQQALALRQQVGKEKAERQKRLRLQERMQHARSLWTQQEYGECIQVLTDLGKEFPAEEEVARLIETVREDQAEQQKQQALLESRNLLAGRRYEESLALLTNLQKQFPRDEEIQRLVEEVRKDQANQRKLQGLAEARNVLASGRPAECISLLEALRKEFPGEEEIARLLEIAHKDQVEQHRQQALAKARKLLASRSFEECATYLTALKKEFPTDEEIPKLLEAVRAGQAELRRQQGVDKARKLLAARSFEECMTFLTSLSKEFADDEEIRKLLEAVHAEQVEQQKRQRLGEVRSLLSAKNYEKVFSLLASLQKEFPQEDDYRKLLDTARKEQAEQRKREGLAEARNLLASRRYEESITLLNGLQKEFPNETEIAKLLETAREDWAEQKKQQKLADARAHLAAQRFAEALTLLDGLVASHPKDTGVLKLRALVQREQEKHAQMVRMQREIEALRKLMNERNYPDVISRATVLLKDFPGDTALMRLAEFASSQQAQIETELLYRKIVGETKALFEASRFEETIRSAQNGMKTLPNNPELLDLLKRAETQQKKLETRQHIEQRIREIRVKINREKFSEAIDLAKQTLVTLGPDTDLTQLLNSAQVEFEAREKKREQERSLETIRTLVESGNLDEANRTLEVALETRVLEAFDSRVQRVTQEIKDAASSAAEKPVPEVPSVPPSFAKEYAFQQGMTAPSAPPPAEKGATTESPTASAPAGQPVHTAQPSVPPLAQPAVPAVPASSPEPWKFVVSEKASAASSTPSAIAPRAETTDRPSSVTTTAPSPKPQPLAVSSWRKPVAAILTTVALAAAIWAGIHFSALNRTNVVVPAAKPQPRPAKPQVDPLETAQRDAINSADKLVAANDLDGAMRALQQAATLNGPLTADIQKKIAGIEESMKDANLRELRQREEVLWQAAKNREASGRYKEAQNDLRQILALPAGGVRKEDATKYLDTVIPQHQQRDRALLEARQDLKQGDFRAARQAAGQIQQNGGDPGQLIAEIDQAEQAQLSQWETQFNQLSQAEDEGAVQKLKALQPKFESVGSSGGPSASEAQTYANNTSKAINDVQARVQNRIAEREFQQAVQNYQQAMGTRDKNALMAARSDLQSIAQRGGSHSEEARKYANDASTRLDALNGPAVPPVAPQVKPPEVITPTVPDNDAAVRAVIQRYAQAFERRDANALRQIWPSMGNRYGRYKTTFEMASSIRMNVAVESVQISADGAGAVVTGQVSQDYTPKGAKVNSRSDRAVFHMAKSNGVWVITDVQ